MSKTTKVIPSIHQPGRGCGKSSSPRWYTGTTALLTACISLSFNPHRPLILAYPSSIRNIVEERRSRIRALAQVLLRGSCRWYWVGAPAIPQYIALWWNGGQQGMPRYIFRFASTTCLDTGTLFLWTLCLICISLWRICIVIGGRGTSAGAPAPPTGPAAAYVTVNIYHKVVHRHSNFAAPLYILCGKFSSCLRDEGQVSTARRRQRGRHRHMFHSTSSAYRYYETRGKCRHAGTGYGTCTGSKGVGRPVFDFSLSFFVLLILHVLYCIAFCFFCLFVYLFFICLFFFFYLRDLYCFLIFSYTAQSDSDSMKARNQMDDERQVNNRMQPDGLPRFTSVGFKKISVPDDVWDLVKTYYEENK